jgi:hypothetical protein
MVELAKERGGHDNITGVVVDVLELSSDSDGVPGVVEQDQTLPVDAKGWDDENTESLSVKEVGKLDETEPLPRSEREDLEAAATRPTAPMSAVVIEETPKARDRERMGRASTDPPVSTTDDTVEVPINEGALKAKVDELRKVGEAKDGEAKGDDKQPGDEGKSDTGK